MTNSEWIALFQTAIVMLTGVVIVWYTFETHRLRKISQATAASLDKQLKATETGHQIAAASALLASYNQYLAVMEDRNNICLSKGTMTSYDTSYLRIRIDALEEELKALLIHRKV
jgi:hypothetical protein